MKKPVIRSPLDRLPTHQKQALLGWLTTGGKDNHGMTLEEAKKRLLQEFGIKTGQSSLWAFYHRHRQPALMPQTTFDPAANTLTIVIKLLSR